jgi:hypothetical protein
MLSDRWKPASPRQLAKRRLTWLPSMPDNIEPDCLAPDLAQRVLKTHKPSGFVAMPGTIAPGGMVRHNTVILIDQIRRDRESGSSPRDAIRKSTVRRSR